MTNVLRDQADELRKILNDWDPIGVQPNGPADEYDCLIVPLLVLLRDGAAVTRISKFLRNELRRHFGLNPYRLRYDKCARKIIAWWRSDPENRQRPRYLSHAEDWR